MDVKEKWSRRLADWYERLRGERTPDLRPRDVLHRIVETLEDQAREGLDGAVYVPNVIVVRVGVHDDDERAYVQAFMDGNELASAIESELIALGYGTRGPLRVTVEDHASVPETPRIGVQCRFEAATMSPVPEASPAPSLSPVPPVTPDFHDPPTRPAGGTIGWLDVEHADGRIETVPVGFSGVRIGRGRQSGNDLVLDDPLVSKAHARIEPGASGLRVIDLNSTNGTWVGGQCLQPDVPCALSAGSTLRVGGTTLVLRMSDDDATVAGNAVPAPPRPESGEMSPFVLEGPGGETWPLGSSMRIGSAVVDDIVLRGHGIRPGHAVLTIDGDIVRVEDRGSSACTWVNGKPIPARLPIVVRPGDLLRFGDTTTRLATRSRPR